MQEYFSRTKLLITGEYLILKGAKGIAMPLKFGQFLKVAPGLDKYVLDWQSRQHNKTWFTAKISLSDFVITETSNISIAANLLEILAAAKSINPDFLSASQGYVAVSEMDFDRSWGLGSSSSLISNIAWWANIDPYKLHFAVSEGSAYDIACARSKQALIYSLDDGRPVVKAVNFNPDFGKKLFFIYSGKKQFSDKSVESFNNRYQVSKAEIETISSITNKLLLCSDIEMFNGLLFEHEMIMSDILKTKRLKDLYFYDFPGEIKSLGAWGGDFFLASSEIEKEKLITYFASKNLKTIFSFDEIKV